MRGKSLILIVCSLLTLSAAAIAATSADSVMQQTIAKAQSNQKNIFLRLCAPRCLYCQKLDYVIDSPQIRPILSKYFVLVTLERGTGDMANPGTQKYFDQYNAQGQGTPFVAILNQNGSLMIDSRANGRNNIGFPTGTSSIDWFMGMLKKGAPQMTAAERQTIKTRLQNAGG